MEGDSPRTVDAALDAATRRSLPAIFAGAGAFYLLAAAVSPLLSGGQEPGTALTARWIGTGVIALTGAWVLRRWPARAGWASPIAGILGVVVVLNSLFLIAAAGPTFLFALAMAELAFAFFLLSMPWVAGLCALGIFGWVYLAIQAGWGPEWGPRTINLVAYCTVAVVAQGTRVALHRRLVVLKERDLDRIRKEHDAEREKALWEQRRRIVRMTAHELATPMTPVLLQAHLLARSDLSPEQRVTLALLQRNLDRLQATIDKVVTAAQEDEKTSDLYQDPFAE